jgi:hypothetical protein
MASVGTQRLFRVNDQWKCLTAWVLEASRKNFYHGCAFSKEKFSASFPEVVSVSLRIYDMLRGQGDWKTSL